MRCLRLGPADQPHDDNDDDDENNDAAEREDHGDSAPFTLGQSSGALEGTRTPDTQVRNLVLYPLSYGRMEAEPGVEPGVPKRLLYRQLGGRRPLPPWGW
jgi:hypothetical protein